MTCYPSRCIPASVLRAPTRDLAIDHRRFGCRRLFVLRRREGEPSWIDRIYRVYQEKGPTVG